MTDRPIVASAAYGDPIGNIRPIVIRYNIPSWENHMDSYDEAVLALRRAFKGTVSEETVAALLSCVREALVERPPRIRDNIQRIAAEQAGGEAGRLFAEAFSKAQREQSNQAPLFYASGFTEGMRLEASNSQILRLTIMLRKLILGQPESERAALLQIVRDVLAAADPKDGDDGAASVPVG